MQSSQGHSQQKFSRRRQRGELQCCSSPCSWTTGWLTALSGPSQSSCRRAPCMSMRIPCYDVFGPERAWSLHHAGPLPPFLEISRALTEVAKLSTYLRYCTTSPASATTEPPSAPRQCAAARLFGCWRGSLPPPTRDLPVAPNKVALLCSPSETPAQRGGAATMYRCRPANAKSFSVMSSSKVPAAYFLCLCTTRLASSSRLYSIA